MAIQGIAKVLDPSRLFRWLLKIVRNLLVRLAFRISASATSQQIESVIGMTGAMRYARALRFH